MKALVYNSKRLAKKIRVLMKESPNTVICPNEQKNKQENEQPMQETHRQPVLLTQQVIDFLKMRYDFRYNLLTEETEFRPSGQRNVSFYRIDKRELNTFCLEAHNEGINCGKLSSFSALHGRVARMGRHRTTERSGKTGIG